VAVALLVTLVFGGVGTWDMVSGFGAVAEITH